MTPPKVFCDYGAGVSPCGMYLKPGEDKCKRHAGKVFKNKISSPKFRGKSNFWKSEQNFNGAIE